MGGFSGELEERIVRTKDHVRVKATGDERVLGTPFVLEKSIAGISGVQSASLYVEGEAMMSSSMNISSTVTVRGIPRTGLGGEFIEKNIVAGSMDFFRHPEDLVSYPGIVPFYRSELTPVSDWDELSPDFEEMPVAPLVAEEAEPDIEVLPEVPGAQGLVMMPSIAEPGGGSGSEATEIAGSAFLGNSGQQVLPPVIIGQELARSMGAGVGSRLTVISPDGDIGPMGVQPKARSFLVAAIFSTGMYEYDLKLAYMYLPHAQRFFNLGEAVDHVDVRLTDLESSGRVRDEILALPAAGSLQVLTWQEMNSNLLSALKLERVVMFIVLGFIILIASFNIIASLIIIIRKRLSAIAILKTMGAAAADITRIFFLLGSAAGLFGIASGVIMGLSSCGIISHLGLTLPREYYIRSLPVSVDGWQVVQIALAALLMTALASLYPGRLASRVLVVEGLKDER
jgi:lipoprotein-releasing system permease protein